MFKVVIIEDEPLARSKLKRLLQDLPDPIAVVAELSSVQETNAMPQQGTAPLWPYPGNVLQQRLVALFTTSLAMGSNSKTMTFITNMLNQVQAGIVWRHFDLAATRHKQGLQARLATWPLGDPDKNHAGDLQTVQNGLGLA